jgi:prepilin-type N-terminal cleavage/methylation domain-containing protein
MKRACRGFSLIELLIAMALVAIVAAIAVPQFQRYSTNTDLKTAAREVMGDFFNARQMAVENTAIIYRITFTVAGNSYVLSRSTPPAAWENVWPNPKSLASFGSGISLYNVNFSGGAVVNFQKRGTVSAGTLILRNRLGSMAVITVNITGRTYVQYSMH